MKKILDLYENMKYKWIIMFILFFPFMKISYLRTITILLPIYSVFRWIFTGILFIIFFFIKKKKPSILFISFIVLELWILIITYFNNPSFFEDCLRDALSIFSIAMFIESFKDEKKDMINALMLNFEIAIYPDLYTIINSLDAPDYHDVVQYLGYYNLLILYVLPAILVAALYIKINKKYIRASLLIVTSVVCVLLSKASTPLMAIISAIALFIFLLIINKYTKMKILSLPFAILAFISNIFIIFVYREGLFPFIDNFIINVLHRQPSFTGRDQLWQKAKVLIKYKPIFGYGYGKGVYADYATTELHPHNDILNRILVGGIIFLVLYLVVNYILNRKIDKQNDSILKILVVSLLFGIYLTFITEAYTNVYLYYIVFFLAYHLDEIVEK